MNRRIGLFILLLVFSLGVSAKELVQGGETVRSFGMGGVRFNSGKDAGAFLWNPGNLGFMKGMNVQLFDLNLGTNALQTYKTFQSADLSSISGFSNLYGEPLYVGGQGWAAFTLPYFGFAVYQSAYLDLMLNNPPFPSLDITYMLDYGYVLGGAIPLTPISALGVNIKRVTRLGGPQQIGASTLNAGTSSTALLDSFQNRGIGYGLDVGTVWKLPVPFSPTFSLGMEDLGATSFQKDQGTSAPPRLEPNLTASTTFNADIGLAGMAFGIEYRHINDANEQLGKKLHAGIELSLLNVDLRAGLYQGYYTYGAGVDLWLMQFDAALYTIEKGAYTGQTPQQRIQVGLSMTFGLDPDFNITDTNGRRRRLKQRR